jgi:membrane protease subunit HflK
VNDYNERSFWPRLRAILSMNDPRWGRGDGNGDKQRPGDPRRPSSGKDGDGPPDLDEMWREFNRRIGSVFGGRKGGGLGRPDNGRGARLGVGIVIGVLIAIYLGSGVFVVQEGEAGIVTSFGQYRDTTGPGVHWRLPYPFEAHALVNVGAVRSVEIGHNNIVSPSNAKDASMLTHDGDILDVRFTVQYQVSNPTDYLFRNADPDQTVTLAAQAAVRAIVGAHDTDATLYQDREAMRDQLVDAIQQTLDASRTGLKVTGVTFQSVRAPDAVQSAFADEAKAREDSARAKADAEAYAKDLLPHAQAQAARMIDDAKTYSERVVAQAQGDAERFTQVYNQYTKAPAVIRERMYLDTMQHIYANTTKVFVDSKAGNNVIYLPLDKLVGAARPAAAASGAGEAAPSPAASAAAAASAASDASAAADAAGASDASGASDPLRSRDLFRNRDRQDDIQ